MSEIVSLLANNSDYCVRGLYRIESEEWFLRQLAVWLKEHPEQNEEYHFHLDEFLAALQLAPLAEAARFLASDMFIGEIHIAEYSSLTSDIREKLQKLEDAD